MPLLIDLNFHSNKGFKDVTEILEKQRPALQFSKYMENNVLFIKHADILSNRIIENRNYIFFRKGNGFFTIPFKTYLYLRKQKPKIVLVQGFIFPIQLIFLRYFLPKQVKIIIQHHGESPYKGIKLLLQRISLRKIEACLFTSIDNAIPWKEKNVIPARCTCFEVIEASTDFRFVNKREEFKKNLHMTGQYNYLWVGRLNSNKDPLTVIKGFSNYYKVNPEARLYMIYQDDKLLPDIKDLIAIENLKGVINLIGCIQHRELEMWFNAADFYISGSHKEGSGYALIEAMACGCIPVVTNIPSFRKLTDNGNCGILYEAGNKDDLLSCLIVTSGIDQILMREKIVEHFNSKLSYQSIAKELDRVCNLLLN